MSVTPHCVQVMITMITNEDEHDGDNVIMIKIMTVIMMIMMMLMPTRER